MPNFLKCSFTVTSNFRRSSSNTNNCKKTCLYNLHKKYNGKMTNFANYLMPIQYSNLSIGESAVHTRENVSIFDVSHMLQTEIRGKDREAFMESLTTADIVGMHVNHGTLSVFTNEKGGILDDLILSKTDRDFLYVVTNAGCIEKDLPYLQENAALWRRKGKEVEVNVLENRGLVAVQGPQSLKVLKQETDIDLDKLYFMNTVVGTVTGIPNCRITRCGYTGEDGFEISIDENKAEELVEKLLSSKKAQVKLAGLGARDVLRLEVGLCLYGNDIYEDTTPGEASLAFVVAYKKIPLAKRRRETLGFPGAEKIVEQLKNKNFAKKRVGFIAEGGRPPRAHLPILDPLNRAAIGFITSGCPSTYLGKNISMGYVDIEESIPGRILNVDFGSQLVKIVVSKLPFVQTNYYTLPKIK